ncbi:hypothetical protein OIV19_21645 [Brucella sp. HL-2]|nr:hypothetical protein [Brucella sp. HL-2]MCV9910202.1 hypothetical protein [Brucella sp. HL-2]
MTSINNDAPFIDMSSDEPITVIKTRSVGKSERVTDADLPGQGLMDGIVLAMDALLAGRKRLASIDPEWDQGDLFPKAIEALNAAPAAIRAMVPIMPGNGFTPTHRHIKKGNDYEYIGGARIQSEVPLHDMDEVAVYLGRDGDLWARRQSEFNTSRFESLPEAPLPPEDPYIAELEADNAALTARVKYLETENSSLRDKLRNEALETQLAAATEIAARAAYRACAETRHVTLGEKAAAAVRTALEAQS